VTEQARVAEGNPSLEVRPFSSLTPTALLFFDACRPGVRRTIEQFEDEIHPRLRFAHRGLVAMANNGAKNSNDSQFFITLGASFPYFYAFPLLNWV